jgi:hypothetical protein
MNFDAIEAGNDGAPRRMAEIGDDAGQFIAMQRPRRRHIDKAFAGNKRLGIGAQRRWADRRLTIVKHCVRDPAAVPELQENDPAPGMYSIGDDLPARHLGIGVTTRGVGITLRLRRNLCGLGDDQAGRGALGIIFRRQRPRHKAGAGAVAGKRCHDDAIGETEIANRDRIEQRRRDVRNGHAGRFTLRRP